MEAAYNFLLKNMETISSLYNTTTLPHTVYKLRHYQTVAGDLPSVSSPTDSSEICSKAATDRSMEFAFSQVGQSSSILTITVCNICQNPDTSKVKKMNLLVNMVGDGDLLPTEEAVVTVLIYLSDISFVDR